jgi:ATP-dependent helicase HepA
MVRGALDLLLGGEAGNSAFGVWKDPAGEAIFLEMTAVVEAVAPASLHVDRFLPATPVRIAVNHALADLTEDAALTGATLEKGDIFRLLDRGAVRKKLLPSMIAKARELATAKMEELTAEAAKTAETQMREEIARLEDLQEINDHIRPEELTALREHAQALRKAIGEAHLRVDALRLIFRIS